MKKSENRVSFNVIKEDMCRNSAEKTKAADEIVKTKLIQCYVSQEFFQAKKKY